MDRNPAGAPSQPMSASGRRGLFVETEPLGSGWLSVGGGHEIYYEECGARAGKPVVVLHGAPDRRSGAWWD
jgi:proline iminopeptidase